jgi:hypothetical protein
MTMTSDMLPSLPNTSQVFPFTNESWSHACRRALWSPRWNQKWEDTPHALPHCTACSSLHGVSFSASEKKGYCDGGLFKSRLLPFPCGNSVTWVYEFRMGKQAGLHLSLRWVERLPTSKTQKASNRRHRCVFFWPSCAASCPWPSFSFSK